MDKKVEIPVHTLEKHAMRVEANWPILERSKPAFRDVGYAAHQPHRHDYFEMFVTASGRGQIRSDGIDQTIGPVSVYVIPPGVVHEWQHFGEVDGFVARVPMNDGFKHLGSSFQSRTYLLQNLSSHRHLMSLLDWILDDAEMASSLMARHQWSLFLQSVGQKMEAEFDVCRQDDNSGLCGSFLALLERKFRLRWGVQDYAHSLGVSRSTLLRCTCENLNRSPAELIRDRTLTEAERLLTLTGKTCAEISEALGFLSQAQFTRAFTAKHGLSPVLFRQNYLEQEGR